MHQVKSAGTLDTRSENRDAFFDPVLRRRDQFSGCGRSRSAEVGNKVCDGEISLMADGGYNWDFRSSDDAGKCFVVEPGEVLQRSTTASDDNDIDE